MNTIVTIILGILSVALITYLLLKKADIKVAMFGIGILLLYIASLSGIAVIKEPVNAFIDPLTSVVSQFKTTLWCRVSHYYFRWLYSLYESDWCK